MDDAEYARRFALEHAHFTDDLPFWARLARELGSPVLDLGAASGRVALHLAREGAEVWAVDASPEMVAELGRRLTREDPEVAARVHPVRADMRALGALGDARFPLAIMAMNTFQLMLSPDDQLLALRAARERLAPGGELCFDVSLPDVGDIAGSLGLVRHAGEHEDPETGVSLLHTACYEDFDPVSQTLRFMLRADERDATGAVRAFVRRFTVHLFLPSELRHLLARAGLEVVAAYGGFSGEPVEAGSERQVYRCRAAAA